MLVVTTVFRHDLVDPFPSESSDLSVHLTGLLGELCVVIKYMLMS